MHEGLFSRQKTPWELFPRLFRKRFVSTQTNLQPPSLNKPFHQFQLNSVRLRAKSKSTMPSVEDILNKIATEYNVKLIPIKDDDLSNNDGLDDEIREETNNNMDSVIARYYVATVLWSHRKISAKAWKQIESKYEPIIELLKTIAQTGSSYKVLRRLSILSDSSTPPSAGYDPVSMLDSNSARATEQSWSTPYVGTAMMVLRRTLQSYLLSSAKAYARYVPIVQSSGTGKSRMVDELGKEVISIPLNLSRSKGLSIPFPPPDNITFLTWLRGSETDCMSESCLLHHYESFLFGLMAVTRERLEEINSNSENDISELTPDEQPTEHALKRISKIAAKFHQEMTELDHSTTREIWQYGEYRRAFYRAVQEKAEEFRSAATELPAKRGSPHRRLTVLGEDQKHQKSPAAEAKKLYEFLDPSCLLPNHLLLIIALDEAHSLADPISLGSSVATFTRFSVLRCALRDLEEQPFFTIFLSTAGRFHQSSPRPESVPSVRLRDSTLYLQPFQPITAVGFDEFADRVVIDGSWGLDRLASTHQIVHLGRALFPTRYDHGSKSIRSGIISFAALKLICHEEEGLKTLATDMQLACLAVRLDLGFQATAWAKRIVERVQVERHMRICLSASPGFTEMVTISPSEPLLAEAALYIMSKPSITEWSAASALLDHIRSSYLKAGDRGEDIASLLILLARDAALREKHNGNLSSTFESPSEIHKKDGQMRIVTVIDFLSSLLSVERAEILSLLPSEARGEDQDRLLQDVFKDAHIWFNHFIKVKSGRMIRRSNLCHLLARGAAALCAINQTGVDIVIPIVFGDRLEVKNVSAILVQVKNDRNYEFQRSGNILFGALDPFAVKLYDDEDQSILPVIRMVFTLCSKAPRVELIKPNLHTSPRHSFQFTAYDIWCSGLTHQTFRVIASKEEDTYQALLSRSCDMSQVYKSTDEEAVKLYHGMQPGVDDLAGHLEKYVA